MEKQCLICGKKSIMAWKLKKLRGKYNPTAKYRKHPNLQWVHVPIEIKKSYLKKFRGKRILACTKCIKSLSKRK
jgi:ribosomal protein L28